MRRRREERWHVLEADDRRQVERWVRNCEGTRVTMWEPSALLVRQVDGEWQASEEPLLPGYVLVRADGGWREAERMLEAVLLRFRRGAPAVLSQEEVARLRAAEGLTVFDVGPAGLRPGDGVRVKVEARSSFAGMRGRFLGLVVTTAGYHARVELGMTRGVTRVAVVPLDHVERSGAGSGEPEGSGERSGSSTGGTSTGWLLMMAEPTTA